MLREESSIAPLKEKENSEEGGLGIIVKNVVLLGKLLILR
jgi:hypothetical protein